MGGVSLESPQSVLPSRKLTPSRILLLRRLLPPLLLLPLPQPPPLPLHHLLQPGGWPCGQPPPHHHSPRPVMRHQAKALRSVALWADGNGAQFRCRSARCTMSRRCAPRVWHRHHDAGKHTQAFSERPDGDSARALRWWARAEGHAGASDA